MFEQLEARRLMSAVKFSDGVSANQGGSGSLSIKGGSKGGMQINVVENGISQLSNGVHIGLGNVLVQDLATGQEAVFYNVKTTKLIKIDAGKGNDTINVDLTSISADIQGKDGDDSITLLERGNGGSRVDAGNGNDMIAVVFSLKADLKGGSGNDVIILNSGATDPVTSPFNYSGSNISVDAGPGDDTMVVFAGNSVIKGNSGNDTVIDNSNSTATYMLFQIENTIIL